MSVTEGKVVISFEATPDQRDKIRENAEWFGLSQAEFMRQAGTGQFLDMQHYVDRGRQMAERERRAAK